MSLFRTVDAVWAKHFQKPFPVSTCVQVCVSCQLRACAVELGLLWLELTRPPVPVCLLARSQVSGLAKEGALVELEVVAEC